MDWVRFKDIKCFLDAYSIKSILGVIPDSKDKSLDVSSEFDGFFEYLLDCKSKGDTIAQHGLNHIYDSKSQGIYGVKKASEFAGHTYVEQYKRLEKGKNILQKYDLWQPYFMAPSHSFDLITLKVLKELNFKYITDGLSLYPYDYMGITLIPQFYSKPLPKLFPGLSQLCIHINTISNAEIFKLKEFVKSNNKSFINIEEALLLKANTRLAFISRKLLGFPILNYKKLKAHL